jgi:hypothetical protein
MTDATAVDVATLAELLHETAERHDDTKALQGVVPR